MVRGHVVGRRAVNRNFCLFWGFKKLEMWQIMASLCHISITGEFVVTFLNYVNWNKNKEVHELQHNHSQDKEILNLFQSILLNWQTHFMLPFPITMC